MILLFAASREIPSWACALFAAMTAWLTIMSLKGISDEQTRKRYTAGPWRFFRLEDPPAALAVADSIMYFLFTLVLLSLALQSGGASRWMNYLGAAAGIAFLARLLVAIIAIAFFDAY
jgi:hypothetical protein